MTMQIDVTAGGNGQGASGDEPIIAEGEGAELEHGDEGTTRQGESDPDLDEQGEHDEPKKKNQPKLPEDIQAQVDRRIGKEVAKRKQIEERATQAETELKELRERVDADDADIVFQAASEFNILPEVIGKGQAAGMLELRRAKQNVKALERALDGAEGDEITIQGKTYDRKTVKQSLYDYRDDVERLEPKFGGIERDAKKRMLDIMRLGQAAQRAGWKPGQKAAAEPEKVQKAKPDASRKPESEDDDVPPARVRQVAGNVRGQEKDSGGRLPGESLAAYFDRQEREKAKPRH